jgi:5-oxoprolinase (ATP-hydrolysing)
MHLNSSIEELNMRLAVLEKAASQKFVEDGVATESMRFERFLNLRYVGSDTTFMIPQPTTQTWEDAFIAEHRRQFSFIMPGRDVVVENIRVRAVAESNSVESEFKLNEQVAGATLTPALEKKVSDRIRLYFSGSWQDANLYFLASLSAGEQIQGPALILDDTQTIVVVPTAKATILERHVVLDLSHSDAAPHIAPQEFSDSVAVDPVQLSVMAHRFMSIAEQMGHTLQKTSVSVNIKERLDFSCALFSPDGRLVANAPHVPVHLGSMEQAVMYQHQRLKDELRPGDVIVANHPISGGTHLPDITCITPVFDQTGKSIIFYTASRGHHQEIGGILPGSMPASSVELYEEGAAIVSEFLVRDGNFDEELITKLLLHDPAQYPACSGSRKLPDNINDLKAQGMLSQMSDVGRKRNTNYCGKYPPTQREHPYSPTS